MINRIFKTILVLTVCAGLTIPTNAAVSVSDGSAFVTKAEFAADLNNLSNRMAQLENSLDSKIDSLVSSYLTRNGIWNGAKQEININGLINQNENYIYWECPILNATWFDALLKQYKSNVLYKDLLFNANKSGLATISLNTLGNNFANDIRYGFSFYANEESVKSNCTHGTVMAFQISDNDSRIYTGVNICTFNSIKSNSQSTSEYTHFGVGVNLVPIVGIIQFFCEKNKSYYTQLEIKVNIGGYATLKYDASYCYGKYYLIFDSIAIY